MLIYDLEKTFSQLISSFQSKQNAAVVVLLFAVSFNDSTMDVFLLVLYAELHGMELTQILQHQ